MSSLIKMSKQELSYCGGICEENSAVIKLYNPRRIYPIRVDEPITFSRVAYCLNHGCGWRQKYPDIHIRTEEAINGKSRGINSYFCRIKKRFPKISVDAIWKIWIYLDVDNFESYLKEMNKIKKEEGINEK